MDLNPAINFFEKPKTARVERTITPQARGRVFYEGTYWPARFYDAVILERVGEAVGNSAWVTVVGRQGLTLLVVPLVTAVCAQG